MNKFSVDYQSLQGGLERKRAFRLEEVKDRIKKVAFDVVRFVDSNNENIDGLWQIQHCDDGDYIVAMYDDETVTKSSSDWSVISDRSGNHVNIFYKGTPVTRVTLASLGIPIEESSLVCEYLPKKLAANEKLVAGLLQDLSSEERNNLVGRHPELQK